MLIPRKHIQGPEGLNSQVGCSYLTVKLLDTCASIERSETVLDGLHSTLPSTPR